MLFKQSSHFEQVCFNKKGNYECDNGKNNSDCEIYASMARISSNDEWKIIVRLKTEAQNLCKRGDRVQDTIWNNSSV